MIRLITPAGLEPLFEVREIKEVSYYLTSPGSNLDNKETVKLGAKINLHNGKKYGIILEIPFSKLKQLVDQYT